MAYKAKNKEVSLLEFQAWLEGVEELQAKDWSPDSTQWKLIRNKIKNIIIPEPVVAETPMVFPGQPAPAVARPAVATNIPGLPPAPEVPGSIPDFAVTAPTEAAAALLGPTTPGAPAKTPNIESDADGKVDSPFA